MPMNRSLKIYVIPMDYIKDIFLRMKLQQCNLFRIKINFFSNIIIERYTISSRSLIEYEQDERNFPSKISISKHWLKLV